MLLFSIVMNKADIIKILTDYSGELKEEINYFLEQYSDDPDYNIIDAFNDAFELAQDYDDTDIIKESYLLFIKIGYAIPVNITNVVTSGGHKYWFRLNKIYYECIDSWQNFRNKL